MSTNALILSGGGARAAYQVGVLQALSDILPSLHNPFPIICGTSAGAINATGLAAHSGQFRRSVRDLSKIWRNLEIEQVFRVGWRAQIGGAAKVVASLFNEGVGRENPVALLDNSPLRELLMAVIPFDNLQNRIDAGDLKALSITALGYNSGESVNFFQGDPSLRGWRRYRRVGTPAKITVDHLLASSAIPGIFPTVRLSQEYFGDGAMRQMAPISSALHLGANRVFIIGVSGNRHARNLWKFKRSQPKRSPSVGQIMGQVFNSVFIDALEGDIEHLERVNQLLELADQERCENTYHLRPVETLIISPSKPLDKIAGRRIRNMPPSMRFFMRKSGATAKGGGSAAASYLLFSHEYCDELMELGYQDTMWERDAVEAFFSSQN
ncbi:patatin-like phospholipase family protein [Agarilytica rhodophyticola]|uniref:patatin-like phospholipase family protein n=1 Tax=Agarilytica rhodophyticola TaxID=1737490 RepID=UPI000B34790B|nr:patatin-like phospholipase family protein [Agarilytica rhodophyticola]